jgi:hypothetical protein
MKPIKGTWIDILHHSERDGVYWNRMTLAYTAEDWRRLVRHLAEDFQLEYLVLTSVVVHRGIYLFPSARDPARARKPLRFPLLACGDPVRAILEAASEFRLKVFVGVGLYPEAYGLLPPRELIEPSLDWVRALAEELLERYGDLPSFHGFYSALEQGFQANGLLDPAHVEWMARFNRTMKELSPERKTLTSPHHCWQIAKANPDPELVAGQISEMAVDYFVPQDGVGFDVPHSPRPAELAHEAFRRLAKICAATPSELWGNVEVFRFENDIYFQPLLPAPWQRIEHQIRGISACVGKIFCYQIPGLMTSQELFPRLGEPGTHQLYLAYRKYLDALPPGPRPA